MFRQLLARLFPRHRPLRIRAIQAIEVGTHEPGYAAVLGEVYRTHAAIHGPNRLLPADALPDSAERPWTSEAEGKSELA
jgi:hypothetical protein